MEKQAGARKVALGKGKHYMSAWGNENIIRNYIAYFEKKIDSEISQFKDIPIDISSAHYPNFAAWIRFYTELICNSLYWKLFRYEGDWDKISKLSFGEIKGIIIDRIKKENDSNADKMNTNEINEMEKVINLILNIRHSFQHGGLPNLMRDLYYKSKEEEIFCMIEPKNYKETEQIFMKADAFIKRLPQRAIHIASQ
jgi:hypothetical protein